MYRCSIFSGLAVLLSVLCLGLSPTAHAQDTTCTHLLVDRTGSTLTITPTYTLPVTTPADTTILRYDFLVERTGVSTSRSRQGGTFTPTPGRVDTLSTVRLTAQPGDRLHLHLVVRRQDETLTEISRIEEISDPD